MLLLVFVLALVWLSLMPEPTHAPKNPAPKSDETRQETERRKAREEALTAAVVRICPGCRRSVIKGPGCSHMTCRFYWGTRWGFGDGHC